MGSIKGKLSREAEEARERAFFDTVCEMQLFGPDKMVYWCKKCRWVWWACRGECGTERCDVTIGEAIERMVGK